MPFKKGQSGNPAGRPRKLTAEGIDPKKAAYARWRERNNEVALQRVRAWRQRNSERVSVYGRKWQIANPDRVNRNARMRTARISAAQGSHTDAEWQALKEQYRYTCLCCRRAEPEITLTTDHVIPVALGGSDWITNIQPLCAECNNRKHLETTDYR